MRKCNHVFYNSVTGEIYYVRPCSNHGQAERNCAANKQFNMTCQPESVLGVVPNVDTYRVNVTVEPHVLEKKEPTPEPPFCVELRYFRNVRLQKSDWTQAADSPLSEEKRAEWAVYRQALRDMQCDSCHCWDDVVWPTIPS